MRQAVLTLPGETIAPPAAPTPHTAWCQINHCRTVHLDATHRHLIGQVAGVEVWVERPDTTSPDGTVDYGTVAVYVFSEGNIALSGRDSDTLAALLGTARMFADEMTAVR